MHLKYQGQYQNYIKLISHKYLEKSLLLLLFGLLWFARRSATVHDKKWVIKRNLFI